ncbi:DUF1269 domain-containing family protein [Streptomyces tateyamensis]|uniref:DUF1269 domain-containing family protein n=2 Tax=Streptomyces tateyamensis TaxID=565073 RepID=A0A2V4N7E0_9ACTN|nr:DUF1269 domain-containing family protein [Streptomyces tateyamensis]
MTGEGLPLLVDLVERGIIRILDLTLVRKEHDGSVVGLQLADVDGDGELDLAVFEGASSGLLGEEEREQAGSLLQPGDSAAILLYENLWAAPLAAALRRAGAQLVAGGRIPVEQIIEALDGLEAQQALS